MDLSTSAFEDASLTDMVGGYMIRAHAFVRTPGETQYERLDAMFRVLRTEQQQHAPHLKEAIDALGAASCDLVNALDPRRAPPPDTHQLLVAHDRAMAGVLDALAPAALAA